MPLEDLFPADFGEELYAEFPPSTQADIGWGGSFQKYVDDLYTEGLIDTTSYVNSRSKSICCCNTNLESARSILRPP